MQQPYIVVVGSSNTDMVVKSARIPLLGETVTGGELFCVPGGKGANQAVAAARLGGQVCFVTKVGDDLFGRQAVEGYQNEGIDVEHIFRTEEAPTGVALILVDESGENLISVASGANHALTAVDVAAVADTIRGASVLMLQLEIPMESVLAAAQIAHEANVPVVLDPAPSPDGPLDPELLRCVSYLTPNETEASRLTGIQVTDQASAREAASKLLDSGPDHVIITLGRAGALACERDDAIMIEAFAVDAIDSTAAGDAFNGGLAVAIGGGRTFKRAVLETCATGALSTTQIGVQLSLPSAMKLDEFVLARGMTSSEARTRGSTLSFLKLVGGLFLLLEYGLILVPSLASGCPSPASVNLRTKADSETETACRSAETCVLLDFL